MTGKRIIFYLIGLGIMISVAGYLFGGMWFEETTGKEILEG